MSLFAAVAVGGRVPRAGLDLRQVLRRGGRGRRSPGAGACSRWSRRCAGVGRSCSTRGAGSRGHADRLLARALKLDARASAPGPLRRRADRSQPPRIGLAADPRRVPVRDRLGVVRAARPCCGRSGGPLLLDHSVRDAMAALRNPLADRMMAALARSAMRSVLGPAAVAALLWLLWRRRWIAAAHWVAALAFGFALTGGLARVAAAPMRTAIRSACRRSKSRWRRSPSVSSPCSSRANCPGAIARGPT